MNLYLAYAMWAILMAIGVGLMHFGSNAGGGEQAFMLLGIGATCCMIGIACLAAGKA